MASDSVLFRGGLATAAVFLAIAAALLGMQGLVDANAIGPTIPVIGANLLAVAIVLSLLPLTWVILQVEAVQMRQLGLVPSLVAPALGAIAVFSIGINLGGIGLALAADRTHTIGYVWQLPPRELLVWALFMLLVAGIVEEVVFRGYLQTKAIAVLGDSTAVGIGGGILLASLAFAGFHLPRVITSGVPRGVHVWEYLVVLVLVGVTLGLVYELTANLYIPIFLHTIGNLPGGRDLVVFSTATWPTWTVVAYTAWYVVVAIATILGYRLIVTGRGPWPHRRDTRLRDPVER